MPLTPEAMDKLLSPLPSLFDRLGGRVVVARVVASFYRRAQLDDLLGPIFDREVHDWPSHIETVSNFWSTQTGGPAIYQGGMGKHLRLGLGSEHFGRWLALWEENARAEVGDELAAELKEIGKMFTERLQQMGRAAAFRFAPGP